MRELCFLLLIIHNHLWLCYGRGGGGGGGEATSTESQAWKATTDMPQVSVSASEATLLTTPPIFDNNKSYRKSIANEDANDPYLEETDVPKSSKGAPKTNESKTTNQQRSSKNRYKIAKVFTNCTRSSFEMHMELNLPFHGLLYAKDFPQECRARGTSERNITLRLPTSGCGVRVEPRSDGSMELSVRIMMQMEEKLRQSSDILRTVKCRLPLNAMGMSLSMADEAKLKNNNR